MRRLIGSAVLAASLALAAAGCGKGTTSTAPGVLTQDAADDAALQVAAGLVVVGGDVSAAGGAYVAGPAPARMTGPAGTTATMWDTTFARGGLAFEVTRVFYDAGGNVLPGWSPLAARMVWTSRASGTLTTERDTCVVGHAGMLDVRNIDAGKDTLDFGGASDDTLDNVFRSYDGTRLRHVHAVSHAIWSDIAMLKNRVANPWPLSGTMTWTVVADRMRANDTGSVETHFEATVVVVFNGTNRPDVTVNGTWHYQLDLATGTLLRV